jgi:hypothetical protein
MNRVVAFFDAGSIGAFVIVLQTIATPDFEGLLQFC